MVLPRIERPFAKMVEALYFDWSIPLQGVSRLYEYIIKKCMDHIGRTLSKQVDQKSGRLIRMYAYVPAKRWKKLSDS